MSAVGVSDGSVLNLDQSSCRSMSLQLTTYFYQSDAERAGPVAFKSLRSSC